MAVPTEMVGDTVGPVVHEVDERWTMAYAAALGDTGACYFDTTGDEGRGSDGEQQGSGERGGIVAHPLFVVCPEWPVIVEGRDAAHKWGITPDETRRSVHATHDVIVHRLVRPGDTLSTQLTYTGVEAKSPGAYTTLRLVTTDANGEPVATTHQGGFHLGVETVGADVPPADTPAPLALGALPEAPLADIAVPVAHGAAHTYTECARIFNPIHTDRAVALQAGLPDIILHGTATLALGISAVVDHCATGEPQRVRRICGRLAAMVLMPSTLTVRIHDRQALDGDAGTGTPGNYEAVRFTVLTQDGAPAINDGVVVLGG